MPFESDAAQLLNKQIFETLYFASVEASCEIAEIEGFFFFLTSANIFFSGRFSFIVPL